jgi:nucleoid-associated protein EbfC
LTVIPGIGGLGNIMELLKHAGKLRGQMEELKNIVVDGSAGGGMVSVRLSGKFEVLDCKIEPRVFAENDVEMLEDLIVAATNQALKKLLQTYAEKTGLMPGGLGLPGLSEFFGAAGGETGGGATGSK